MDLLNVQSIEDAVARAATFFDTVWERQRIEVALTESLGRFLAEDIYSREEVPNFTRSTVDGYAVRAKDTQGASDGLPVLLRYAGSVAMGEDTNLKLKPGETAYVPTGGMLPAGADAMVMVEYCEDYQIGEIAIHRPVALGDHVMRKGSDMDAGDLVLPAGRVLSPYDVAALATLGIARVPVWVPPRMSVFSSGDEVIPMASVPQPAQVRDSNSYGAAAQGKKFGWDVVRLGHLADDPTAFLDTLKAAMADSDMVVVSGGSSKGKKDYTAQTFAALGEPGIFTHGLAMKPGKPTLLAGADQCLLVGLPGHPVSAMMVFEALLSGFNTHLFNQGAEIYETAILSENIHGSPGQTRVIPANLFTEEGESIVRPRHGKSGQISTLTDSDVLIFLPRHAEGARAGDRVQIRRIR